MQIYTHRQKGSVLLLALLILSSVLVTSIAVSTLVAKEIRTNRQLDDAVVSYYAAESGIERGLWVAKMNTSLATNPSLLTGAIQLPNNAGVALRASNMSETIIVPYLPKGTTKQIDVYRTGNATDLSAGVDTLRITNEGPLKIVSCKERAANGALVNCANVALSSDVITGLNPVKAYRLLFAAEGEDVRDIRIAGTKAGIPVALATPLTIASTGSFTTSRQALEVQLPTASPLDNQTAGIGASEGESAGKEVVMSPDSGGSGSEQGTTGGTDGGVSGTGSGTATGDTGGSGGTPTTPAAPQNDFTLTLEAVSPLIENKSYQFLARGTPQGEETSTVHYWVFDTQTKGEASTTNSDVRLGPTPPPELPWSLDFFNQFIVPDIRAADDAELQSFPSDWFAYTPQDIVDRLVPGKRVTVPFVDSTRPSYTFPSAGTYTISIFAISESGKHAAASLVVEVRDAPPKANAGADQVIMEDRLVTFDGSASTGGFQDTLSYAWDVDASNGLSFDPNDSVRPALIGVKPTFTYTTPGIYTATLEVRDPAGQTSRDTLVVTVVQESLPVAAAGPDVLDAVLGRGFYVDASASQGIALSYKWDKDDRNGLFEDPLLINKRQIIFYQDPGTYTVTLEVRDPLGRTDRDTLLVKATKGDVTGQMYYVSSVGGSILIDSEGKPVFALMDTYPLPDNNLRLRIFRCDDANCATIMCDPQYQACRSRRLATPVIEDIVYPPNANTQVRILAIALDTTVNPKGNPVLLYQRGEKTMQLVRCQDTLCTNKTTRTIDTIAENEYFGGLRTALTIDSRGNPVAVYTRHQATRFVRCQDPLCTTTVTADLPASNYFDIVLDSIGNPVISYSTAQGIILMHCTNANCSSNQPSAVVDAGLDKDVGSLALDASGNPVIAYDTPLASGTTQVMLAHCTDSKCNGDKTVAPVATAPAPINISKLFLDIQGNPVFAYGVYQQPSSIRLVHCTDAYCTGEKRQREWTNVRGGATLTLDPDGNPILLGGDLTTWSINFHFVHCYDTYCAPP